MLFRPAFSTKIKNRTEMRPGQREILIISAYGLALSISTQMLYSQLALYMKYELKTGECKIALLDGFVEFVSYIVRILAGILSDYMHNRRLLMAIGCGVLCMVKPIFALSQSVAQVLWAEIAERLGNGVQACPRDAMISDWSSRERLAASFGFFKSMKTVGALLGATSATIILGHWDYRTLFWCAGIPALASASLLLAMRDAPANGHEKSACNPFRKKYLRSLKGRFWIILLLAATCELSHFGESLLTLRASTLIPQRFAGMTAVFMALGPALLAYPMGLAADRRGKIPLLRLCLRLSICAYVCLLLSDSAWTLFGAVMILCGQQASMQSIFLALIGECVDKNLRATAIGMFYGVIGGSYLMASGICGKLWEIHGHEAAFIYGAAMSTLGLTAVGFFRTRLEASRQ